MDMGKTPAVGDDGSALVPDGLEIMPGHHRKVQVRRVTKNGWTKAKRAVFLETLASSCNVQMACAAAGLLGSTVYRRRACDTDFAAAWEAALQIGYDRLEQALLRRALQVADGFAVAESCAELPPMTIAQAMDFLLRHRTPVPGQGGQNPLARQRLPTAVQTDELLRRKLDAYDRSQGIKA